MTFTQTCRAFTGAWIETSTATTAALRLSVAPSQARGSKLASRATLATSARRAFTGAWIETMTMPGYVTGPPCRAFTGAWIETTWSRCSAIASAVAPSQARGSKQRALRHFHGRTESRLHRRVDRNRDITDQGLRKQGRAFTGAWIETDRPHWHYRHCRSRLHRRVDRNATFVRSTSTAARRAFTGAWIRTVSVDMLSFSFGCRRARSD